MNNELEKALETLETFTANIENEAYPNLSHFEVKEGRLVVKPYTSLKKIIHLACSIAATPSEKEIHKSGVINQVLQSSDTVKSYSSLFHALEDGTEEQKKFAANAKTAIERFNKILEKSAVKPPSIRKRIVRFLYEKSGFLIGKRLCKIDLPQKNYLQIEFPAQSLSSVFRLKKVDHVAEFASTYAVSQKASLISESVMSSTPFNIANQTLELYYMKVIALLEKHCSISNPEARALVKQTNRCITVDKDNQVVTLSQSLTPIPGLTIDVAGSFKRDARTLAFTIPLPESYQLTIQSKQTGFPHPLQHHGWALSNDLIPACLHRPEQIALFPVLIACKMKASQALLPKGTLVDKAKTLLKMKKQVFNANKNEFLAMHQKLYLEIGKSIYQDKDFLRFQHILDRFIAYVDQDKNPYDLLSKVNQLVMKTCVELPYQVLHQAWLDNRIKDPSREAENILKEGYLVGSDEIAFEEAFPIEDMSLMNFWREMSKIFAYPARMIILQHQSEIMKFAPPKLNDFTKKVQLALYLQLWEFQHELALNIHEVDMKRRLYRLLEDEITLFASQDPTKLPLQAAEIVLELERYYYDRSR